MAGEVLGEKSKQAENPRTKGVTKVNPGNERRIPGPCLKPDFTQSVWG